MSFDVETREQAVVSPENVKHLGGAQTVDDKVNSHLKQIEADANTGESDKMKLVYYAMIPICFFIGGLIGEPALLPWTFIGGAGL